MTAITLLCTLCGAAALSRGVLRLLVRELNTALQGRGGGKPFFAQGSVSASRAAIEAFFRERGE